MSTFTAVAPDGLATTLRALSWPCVAGPFPNERSELSCSMMSAQEWPGWLLWESQVPPVPWHVSAEGDGE